MNKENKLEHLLGYYRVILELTYDEHDKLQRERPADEITTLTRKKKIIMTCIIDLDKEIKPYTKSMQDYLIQIRNVVGEILSLDQQNKMLMHK
jgi:hypothetical protein